MGPSEFQFDPSAPIEVIAAPIKVIAAPLQNYSFGLSSIVFSQIPGFLTCVEKIVKYLSPDVIKEYRLKQLDGEKWSLVKNGLYIYFLRFIEIARSYF